ncbi:unnamed protein product [Prorocentrum cordatum]|uniref:Uncharacterized protein n=1 Tax=Prorocentrum cordatum TaxID=2364126 RepID=A0ABN9V7P7_9DINO|nr:unnamed protein product [Polarella glacialis]
MRAAASRALRAVADAVERPPVAARAPAVRLLRRVDELSSSSAAACWRQVPRWRPVRGRAPEEQERASARVLDSPWPGGSPASFGAHVGLDIAVSKIEASGRGVFSRGALHQGALVEVCPVLTLQKDDVALGSEALNYFFQGPDGDVLLCVLGFGMMYNHASGHLANLSYSIRRVAPLPGEESGAGLCVALTAARPVAAGAARGEAGRLASGAPPPSAGEAGGGVTGDGRQAERKLGSWANFVDKTSCVKCHLPKAVTFCGKVDSEATPSGNVNSATDLKKKLGQVDEQIRTAAAAAAELGEKVGKLETDMVQFVKFQKQQRVGEATAAAEAGKRAAAQAALIPADAAKRAQSRADERFYVKMEDMGSLREHAQRMGFPVDARGDRGGAQEAAKHCAAVIGYMRTRKIRNRGPQQIVAVQERHVVEGRLGEAQAAALDLGRRGVWSAAAPLGVDKGPRGGVAALAFGRAPSTAPPGSTGPALEPGRAVACHVHATVHGGLVVVAIYPRAGVGLSAENLGTLCKVVKFTEAITSWVWIGHGRLPDGPRRPGDRRATASGCRSCPYSTATQKTVKAEYQTGAQVSALVGPEPLAWTPPPEQFAVARDLALWRAGDELMGRCDVVDEKEQRSGVNVFQRGDPPALVKRVAAEGQRNLTTDGADEPIFGPPPPLVQENGLLDAMRAVALLRWHIPPRASAEALGGARPVNLLGHMTMKEVNTYLPFLLRCGAFSSTQQEYQWPLQQDAKDDAVREPEPPEPGAPKDGPSCRRLARASTQDGLPGTLPRGRQPTPHRILVFCAGPSNERARPLIQGLQDAGVTVEVRSDEDVARMSQARRSPLVRGPRAAHGQLPRGTVEALKPSRGEELATGDV